MSVVKVRKDRIYQTALEYSRDYKNALIFSKTNVPVKIIKEIKKSCGDDVKFLFGKGSVIRKALSSSPKFTDFSEQFRQNVGLAFSNKPLSEVKSLIEAPSIVASAKSGQISQCDYYLPAGPTGVEVGSTAMFQALDIPTKVVSSQLSIANDTLLLREGKRVNKAQINLLNLFGLSPFNYKASGVTAVLDLQKERPQLFSAKYLELGASQVAESLSEALKELQAVSVACGLINELTVRRFVAEAIRESVAVSACTKNPIAEAKRALDGAKNVVVEKQEEKIEAPKAAEEPEESEDVDLDDMFD